MSTHPLVKELFAEADFRSLTHRELAKLTNISQSTFSTWRRGDHQPRLDKLERFANALDRRIVLR